MAKVSNAALSSVGVVYAITAQFGGMATRGMVKAASSILATYQHRLERNFGVCLFTSASVDNILPKLQASSDFLDIGSCNKQLDIL